MGANSDYSYNVSVAFFSSIAGILLMVMFWGVHRIKAYIDTNTNIESRCRHIGILNSVRLDDDGEYHFSTNQSAYYDIDYIWVHIERKDIDRPTLCKYESRRVCKSGYGIYSDWGGSNYKIELPNNYKVETFDD